MYTLQEAIYLMNGNINLIRRLQYEFKYRKKECKISFLVRIFFILLVSAFILDAQSLFQKFNYNKLGESILIWGLPAGYIFFLNFGLFFITTKLAKKFKISATMIYLPCIFLLPSVLTSWSTHFIETPILGLFSANILLYYLSIFIFFLVFLAIYTYFYPWRDTAIKIQWSFVELARSLKSGFETNRIDFLFKLSIRIFSLILVGFYIWRCYQVLFEWYRYTLDYFIHAFVYYLIFGIACNFGLFFITTKAAKKNRFCSTLTFSLSLLVTPIFLGSFVDHWGGIILLAGHLLIYFYFYPWRK